MHQKRIQQLYLQYINKKSAAIYKHLIPETLALQFTITSNHFKNLEIYRNNLMQQIKMVDTQLKKDNAEVRLIELNIKQSILTLCQQKQMLKKQLTRLQQLQKQKIIQRDRYQQNNLQNVSQLKLKFQEQQKLRAEQKNNKLQIQNIKMQTKLQKQNAQKNGYSKIVEKTALQISNINERIIESKQKLKLIEQNQQRFPARMRQLSNNSLQLRQRISIRQKFVMTLENQIQKQQKQLSYLKNKVSLTLKNRDEILSKNFKLTKQIQKQQQISQTLYKTQGELQQEIIVITKDLEMEEKDLQHKVQQIQEEKEKIQANKIQLKHLKLYIKQLLSGNLVLQEILSKFHHRDLAITSSLLERLHNQSRQKIKINNVQRVTQKQDKFFTNSKILNNAKCLNKEQLLEPKPKLKIMKNKMNSIVQQQLSILADNIQKNTTGNYFNKQFQRIDLRQLSKSKIKDSQVNQLKEKENYLQRTASSEFRQHYFEMPKHVSNIISKYKNHQSSILQQSGRLIKRKQAGGSTPSINKQRQVNLFSFMTLRPIENRQ